MLSRERSLRRTPFVFFASTDDHPYVYKVNCVLNAFTLADDQRLLEHVNQNRATHELLRIRYAFMCEDAGSALRLLTNVRRALHLDRIRDDFYLVPETVEDTTNSIDSVDAVNSVVDTETVSNVVQIVRNVLLHSYDDDDDDQTPSSDYVIRAESFFAMEREE